MYINCHCSVMKRFFFYLLIVDSGIPFHLKWYHITVIFLFGAQIFPGFSTGRFFSLAVPCQDIFVKIIIELKYTHRAVYHSRGTIQWPSSHWQYCTTITTASFQNVVITSKGYLVPLSHARPRFLRHPACPVRPTVFDLIHGALKEKRKYCWVFFTHNFRCCPLL